MGEEAAGSPSLYREVLVFHSGDNSYSAHVLCGDIGVLSSEISASSTVRLDGAICRNGTPVRAVRARAPDIASDDALANLVKYTQNGLFQSAQRNRGNNNDDDPSSCGDCG